MVVVPWHSIENAPKPILSQNRNATSPFPLCHTFLAFFSFEKLKIDQINSPIWYFTFLSSLFKKPIDILREKFTLGHHQGWEGVTRLHTSLLGPDHYDVATVTQSLAVERYYTCLILSVREKVCNICLIKRMHGYILSYVSQSVKQ